MMTNAQEIAEMYTPEPLVPELAACYMEKGPLGTPMIRHSLYISIFHPPQLNRMANLCFASKREEVDRAAKAGEWTRYLLFHERPFRTDAMIRISQLGGVITDDIMAWIWTDQENPHIDTVLWFTLFDRASPKLLMTEKEYAEWNALPQEIIVYRGSDHEPVSGGLSWTLNKEKAEWFATRYGRQGRVVEATVPRKKTRALFLGRGEQEIIYSPRFGDTI